MNRVLVLAAAAPKVCTRHLSTTGIRCKKPDLSKIKKKQLLYQEENGIPVYLKGGAVDYVLYYTTIGLIAVGLGAGMHSCYKLVFNH